jgi:hypothetical protein
MTEEQIVRHIRGLTDEQSYWEELTVKAMARAVDRRKNGQAQPEYPQPPPMTPELGREMLRANKAEAQAVEAALRGRVRDLFQRAKPTGIAKADWRRARDELKHWEEALNGHRDYLGRMVAPWYPLPALRSVPLEPEELEDAPF